MAFWSGKSTKEKYLERLKLPDDPFDMASDPAKLSMLIDYADTHLPLPSLTLEKFKELLKVNVEPNIATDPGLIRLNIRGLRNAEPMRRMLKRMEATAKTREPCSSLYLDYTGRKYLPRCAFNVRFELGITMVQQALRTIWYLDEARSPEAKNEWRERLTTLLRDNNQRPEEVERTSRGAENFVKVLESYIYRTIPAHSGDVMAQLRNLRALAKA